MRMVECGFRRDTTGGPGRERGLTGKLGEADDVSTVIKRDREVAKQIHASEDQGTMLVGGEHAPDSQRMPPDVERQPPAMDANPGPFDAEKDLLRTP